MPILQLSEGEAAMIMHLRDQNIAPLTVVHDPAEELRARLRAMREELCDPKECAPYGAPGVEPF